MIRTGRRRVQSTTWWQERLGNTVVDTTWWKRRVVAVAEFVWMGVLLEAHGGRGPRCYWHRRVEPQKDLLFPATSSSESGVYTPNKVTVTKRTRCGKVMVGPNLLVSSKSLYS